MNVNNYTTCGHADVLKTQTSVNLNAYTFCAVYAACLQWQATDWMQLTTDLESQLSAIAPSVIRRHSSSSHWCQANRLQAKSHSAPETTWSLARRSGR